MTGLQLIRELRAIRPDLPVILSTGDAASFNFTDVKTTEGMSDLSLKPHTLLMLATSVNRVLHRHRARRGNALP